jgi:hypothetical protein
MSNQTTTHSQNSRRDRNLDSQLRAFKMHFYPALGLYVIDEGMDKASQYAGIDIYAAEKENPENGVLIDEKCSVSKNYLEGGLSTFLQELQFRYIGDDHSESTLSGWAIDTEKQTTHYMLFIPIGTMEGTRVTRINNITAYYVSKKAINDYFASYGYTARELLDIFNSMPKDRKFKDKYNSQHEYIYIRKKDSLGRYDISEYPYDKDNYIKIVQSFNLPEQPINIPIPRKHLDRISKVVHRIYTEEESDTLLHDAENERLLEKVNAQL